MGRRDQRRRRGRCPQFGTQGVQSRVQPFAVGGAQDEDVHCLVPGRCFLRIGILFQHHVEVAAAEAEGAHRAAAGMIRPAGPRARGGVEIKRAVGDVEAGVRGIHLQGGQQHLVVQGQHRLDQAGGTGGGLGVADHRFHRSQSAGLAGALTGSKHRLEGLELHLVADAGARAVGFHHLHGVRLDPGAGVGSFEGFHLAFPARGVDAAGTGVAGSADAADDGVDPVAVLFGRRQGLEHHQPDALAQHGAIGLLGKGAGVAAGREDLALGEAHVHEDVVEHVGAAGDGHPAAAGPQFQQGEVEGRQGAGAGGVHGAVGAAEVEAVADAAGHHVAQQAGKGAFLPGDILVADGGHGLFRRPGIDTGLQHGLPPAGMAEPAGQGNDQLLGAGDSENHAGVLPVEGALPRAVAGIGEGHARR